MAIGVTRLSPVFAAPPPGDAANAVPYELYDESTARTKIENAQVVIAWLERKIGS